MDIVESQSLESKTLTEIQWYLEGCPENGEPLRRIAINTPQFQIGRRSDLQLCLDCSTVSKVHAEILMVGEGLLLRDLQSRNGTFVNGHPVTDAVPIQPGDLIQFAEHEFRLGCRRTGSADKTALASGVETAWKLTQFDHLLNQRAVIPYFQPVLDLATGSTFGYEALARSNVTGFENPRQMFQVADQLKMAERLSDVCRANAALVAWQLPGAPSVFFNTHPSEKLGSGLFQSLQALRQAIPGVPLVLELHEAAVTSVEEVRELRAALDDFDIGLAYDDFGAGQARLLDLVAVPPDFLKFDMGLIRDIDKATCEQHRLIAALVRMVRDLGIAALAEGIETPGEAAACAQLGFDYGQGYLFGRPAPISAYVGPRAG